MSITLKPSLLLINGVYHMIRGLQNTAFVDRMMRAPPCVGDFRKAPMETKSKQKEVQFMNCKRSWTKRLL